MIWTRKTWKDGVAVCENEYFTPWRKKRCGEYEIRHLHTALVSNCPVSYAKVNQSWKYLPFNWEVV